MSRLGGPHIPVRSSMTEPSHLLGPINGVYNEKDKSNHVYVVKRLRVDKLELLLLDDIAIKVYEFALWWPLERFPASCKL